MASQAAVSLAHNVWRIPTAPRDLANCFAIRDDGGSITLVDAGATSSWKRLQAGLAQIKSHLSEVRQVVVTHAHSDHVGSLAAVVKATAARVSAHEREAIYLREGRTPHREPAYHPEHGFHKVFNHGLSRITGRRFAPLETVEEFHDGATLDIAGGLRVIHTPGHTPGHVSLLHEPTGVLMAGDAVVNVRELRWSPHWLCTDATLNKTSTEILGNLNFSLAAFSHGTEIRHKAREAVRAFLGGREA